MTAKETASGSVWQNLILLQRERLLYILEHLRPIEKGKQEEAESLLLGRSVIWCVPHMAYIHGTVHIFIPGWEMYQLLRD